MPGCDDQCEASYEKADILIADLPCSGLGILGKKPDLKSKMTVEMAERTCRLTETDFDSCP